MVLFDPNSFLPNHPVSVTVTNDQGETACECYQINPHHRNSNPNKSQWTISKRKEVELFGWSMSVNSLSDNIAVH